MEPLTCCKDVGSAGEVKATRARRARDRRQKHTPKQTILEGIRTGESNYGDNMNHPTSLWDFADWRETARRPRELHCGKHVQERGPSSRFRRVLHYRRKKAPRQNRLPMWRFFFCTKKVPLWHCISRVCSPRSCVTRPCCGRLRRTSSIHGPHHVLFVSHFVNVAATKSGYYDETVTLDGTARLLKFCPQAASQENHPPPRDRCGDSTRHGNSRSPPLLGGHTVTLSCIEALAVRT